MKCRLARWLHHIAYRLEGRCVVCHAGNGNHVYVVANDGERHGGMDGVWYPTMGGNVYYFEGEPHRKKTQWLKRDLSVPVKGAGLVRKSTHEIDGDAAPPQ